MIEIRFLSEFRVFKVFILFSAKMNVAHRVGKSGRSGKLKMDGLHSECKTTRLEIESGILTQIRFKYSLSKRYYVVCLIMIPFSQQPLL